MYKITPFVLAIIKNRDKYLLTLRKETGPGSQFDKVWQFPGGAQEFGETAEEALHREIKEELGARIKIKHKITRYMHFKRKYWHGLCMAFICELVSPDTKFVLNEEAYSYQWFTLTETKKLPMMPSTGQILEETEKYETTGSA